MRKRSAREAANGADTRPPARAHGENATATTTDESLDTSNALSGKLLRPARADVALAALVLGVYIRTLYPSVAGGDSGELVAESCHLGVSHPPGYPLFNLIVHAFATRLPWDWMMTTTIAWRANVFSAGGASCRVALESVHALKRLGLFL